MAAAALDANSLSQAVKDLSINFFDKDNKNEVRKDAFRRRLSDFLVEHARRISKLERFSKFSFSSTQNGLCRIVRSKKFLLNLRHFPQRAKFLQMQIRQD